MLQIMQKGERCASYSKETEFIRNVPYMSVKIT